MKEVHGVVDQCLLKKYSCALQEKTGRRERGGGKGRGGRNGRGREERK